MSDVDKFGSEDEYNPLGSERISEKEKVERRIIKDPHSGWLIGACVILAVIVLVLFISYGFKWILPEAPTTKLDYGPYHFELDKDNSWRFEWQRDGKVYSVPLRYNPYYVENVSVSGSLNETFNRQNIYITFDPTSGNFSTESIATAELALNMVRALQITPIAACTKNETVACIERPIVNCGDPGVSVILIKDEGEAKIWLKDECVVLFGEEFELLRSVDRLLYQWYGIMD